MSKYAVIMDYIMTATIVVDAHDERSAEDKAWRYVHSREGFDEYVKVAAPNNVLFGKQMWDGDGFEIACDAEMVGDGPIDRANAIEI